MSVVFSNVFNSFIIHLPTSKSLSYFWNFGSFLGMVYVFQVFSGLFLVFYYSNDYLTSFSSVQYLIYEVNFGWLLRLFHFNGASLFFLFLFLHFFKALFFFSYRLVFVWVFGLLIFLFIMAIAFIGYVLVWAQISFWACVVITSLLTVIPFFGFDLVYWIWSGFSVSGATLKFFFVLHFFLPWVLLIFLFFHFFFLHHFGSTSSLFYCGGLFNFNFFPFFWVKDAINFLVFLLFFVFVFLSPWVLGDPEMFLEADPLVSPVHIVPEWYFLFAYAILRSIPNNVLGVFFLVFSIVSFFLFLLFSHYHTPLNVSNKFLVYTFFFVSLFLSWLGQCQVEYPYLFLGALFTVLYFFFVFLLILNYFLSSLLFLYLL